MAEENVNKEGIFIISLCLIWYITSSCNNVIGKTLLNEFPYPLTVTIAQLLSITLFSGPVLKCMGVKPRRTADISWSYYKKFLIPLSLGKFFAVVLTHVSLWKVPVSYTHTVKATMPLFTVFLARLCLGEKQSMKVYISLLPIMIGVGIATITELSFNVIGLLSALASTCVFSLLHIYSKKVLNDTGIHHLRLIHLLGKLAFVMFLPVWVAFDGLTMLNDKKKEPSQTLLLLFLDGFLNWLQNFIAFTILSHVSPLTYSVANASKRIAVISVSLAMLRNPVTLTNIFGIPFY
ncbi:Solute carrier family 35 member E1-like protein [Armadillidium vulgare]|nr:Solute carrier family 35 member E1-like protein [Armadillidium vulgare]